LVGEGGQQLTWEDAAAVACRSSPALCRERPYSAASALLGAFVRAGDCALTIGPWEGSGQHMGLSALAQNSSVWMNNRQLLLRSPITACPSSIATLSANPK